jgi:hypothetical protein
MFFPFTESLSQKSHGIAPPKCSGIFDADAAQTLGTMAQQGIRILLGLGIFGTVVEIIKSTYKLLTQGLSAKT